jgi:hypothetical protein
MNITYGIGMICVAVAMIWFAIPADGVSAPFLKSHWIVRSALRDDGHGHIHHGRRCHPRKHLRAAHWRSSAIRLLLGGKRTSPCGWLEMRDLGAVLDHEEPLPHPACDQVQ